VTAVYAVSVKNLVKRFGEFAAVAGVSFDVEKGEVFGFLGPNGAGKSTTIKMLCGILEPTSGSGTVAGYDIIRERREIKQHIGYMSQKFSLYDDLSVMENIDFYAGVYGIPSAKRKERKEWALETVGLSDARKTKTAILPTGFKQRLALACAVLHEPPVLILDEPTSGVDPLSRKQFWDLIYDFSNSGRTVFVTTHYMDEAEHCGRIGLIYRGELIALDTSEYLKKRFMHEKILEIKHPRPQEVLEDVSKLAGVREAALFGSGLHVVAGDAAAATQSVREYFAKKYPDAPVSVNEIAPSLEDVFVSLIEERDRAAGAIKAVER
jgi:ABC-2 type transport system ATP-binding protein